MKSASEKNYPEYWNRFDIFPDDGFPKEFACELVHLNILYEAKTLIELP